ALLGPWIAPFDPESTGAGAVMAAPGALHWMGTDELGRDVFSRICFGVRTSLMIGVAAAAIATGTAVVVGALAGYFGGWIDDALMRLTEVFQVIPRFFLAILLVAFFGANVVNIVVAIGILSWPEVARIVRSEFLGLKGRQFVAAARVGGAGTAVLIFVEILPNAMGPVIVNATLQVGQAMLLEAGLSYLGLGDPRQISLGLMLYQAQEIMRTAWWATAFPGLFVFLAVLSVNLLGDGLNDVFNPRARGR
ncbi:MAG: ABC transporter permease, partial [Alphaproteobacteria bacterium]|nr:ABC transporter permease [Alphaproteobacteria bacterium]